MKNSKITNYPSNNDSVCQNFSHKLRRLLHWAPLIALFIIFFITIVTTNCIIHVYHPFSNLICFMHFLIFLYEFYLIMNNYLTASFIGPGFVPLEWHPELEVDKQYLQFCELCEGYKPPRSHHCRKCDRCVMKMDHHCPWINTCCGHFNHGYFVYFLFFAPLGCLHSTYILGLTLYYAIYVDYFFAFDDSLIVILSLVEFLCTFFAAGLAIGVVIAVGSLWVIQIKSIMKNETGVETWIKEKSQLRIQENNNADHFIYPYDLGRMQNLREIISWSGQCKGNGILWTVREGCGQYDLTVEQIKQKKDKALHSQNYEIKRPYSGSLIPLFTFDCRISFGSPCTDENRLPVSPGQIVKVTRWRKHWLYGQIIYPIDAHLAIPEKHRLRKGKPRGWFPTICARMVFDEAAAGKQLEKNGKFHKPHGTVAHTKSD